MLKYYVYAYLREKDSPAGKAGSPYYIGKGCGYRAWDLNHEIGLPLPAQIIILERDLSEIGALALERRMIRWYGRIDQGTGCLRNKTDGGDGLTTPSSETRRKMSIAKLGTKQDPVVTAKRMSTMKLRNSQCGMRGSTHTQEWKNAQSLRFRGQANNSKLSEKEALEIIKRLATRQCISLASLADEYKVTRMTISAINNHRLWRPLSTHLNSPINKVDANS